MNFVFVAALLVCKDLPKADFAQTDYNPLAGTWVVCGGMRRGRPTPRGTLGEKWPIVFNGPKTAQCGGVKIVVTGPSTLELHVAGSPTHSVSSRELGTR
jgi:hypothetical protein